MPGVADRSRPRTETARAAATPTAPISRTRPRRQAQTCGLTCGRCCTPAAFRRALQAEVEVRARRCRGRAAAARRGVRRASSRRMARISRKCRSTSTKPRTASFSCGNHDSNPAATMRGPPMPHELRARQAAPERPHRAGCRAGRRTPRPRPSRCGRRPSASSLADDAARRGLEELDERAISGRPAAVRARARPRIGERQSGAVERPVGAPGSPRSPRA